MGTKRFWGYCKEQEEFDWNQVLPMYGIFFNKLPGFRVEEAAKTWADNVCMGTFYLPASLSASDFKKLAGRTQGSHNHVRDPSVSPS